MDTTKSSGAPLASTHGSRLLSILPGLLRSDGTHVSRKSLEQLWGIRPRAVQRTLQVLSDEERLIELDRFTRTDAEEQFVCYVLRLTDEFRRFLDSLAPDVRALLLPTQPGPHTMPAAGAGPPTTPAVQAPAGVPQGPAAQSPLRQGFGSEPLVSHNRRDGVPTQHQKRRERLDRAEVVHVASWAAWSPGRLDAKSAGFVEGLAQQVRTRGKAWVSGGAVEWWEDLAAATPPGSPVELARQLVAEFGREAVQQLLDEGALLTREEREALEKRAYGKPAQARWLWQLAADKGTPKAQPDAKPETGPDYDEEECGAPNDRTPEQLEALRRRMAERDMGIASSIGHPIRRRRS